MTEYFFGDFLCHAGVAGSFAVILATNSLWFSGLLILAGLVAFVAGIT